MQIGSELSCGADSETEVFWAFKVIKRVMVFSVNYIAQISKARKHYL